MPANPKHLDPSFHQRFAKITAGFMGGYIVTATLFMAIALWADHVVVLMTMKYMGFILWGGLMIVPFLFRNGWKAWAIYLVLALVFTGIIYLSKTYFLLSVTR